MELAIRASVRYFSCIHAQAASGRKGTTSTALAVAKRRLDLHTRNLGVNLTDGAEAVSAFEKQLGLRLFERLPSGYVLTAGGEELRGGASHRRHGDEPRAQTCRAGSPTFITRSALSILSLWTPPRRRGPAFSSRNRLRDATRAPSSAGPAPPPCGRRRAWQRAAPTCSP